MKNKKHIVIFVLIVFTLITGRLIYLEEQGNFWEISKNRFYRSAQLDSDELEKYIKQYKIRTIINLRGDSNAQWYKDEINICNKFNINHIDLSLSATSEPSESKINKLISILQKASFPILVHCKAGADRSGLATAIWLVTFENKPYYIAKQQLSLIYGHFSIGPTKVMDNYLKKWYEKYKKKDVI
ncbi:tyrosine-protein phosphatase [Deferribacteraceae bacterium V6Fe1]|nr:tyrosine-protein phosphatase [Deferribacteraceae bacterium V6Fe1]